RNRRRAPLMARLYVFAEGQTEQTFADNVLKPHLARFGVYMHRPVLIAHARKKGRVHRGGGRKYLPMRNDILRFTKQEKTNPDVYFTTMIDLYALPGDFPGLDEAEKLRRNPFDRVRFLQQQFAEDIGDRRFVPFLQLHEFEAYLFCGLECFRRFFDTADARIEALQKVCETFANPELIDDGERTAPSKRIIAQFCDYEDAKATIGPQVAETIGLATIRGKCPHFGKWLECIEGLGRA
ncbi:MAG: DUF4276 family protein, partial [Thermoguttaceae bacterium]